MNAQGERFFGSAWRLIVYAKSAATSSRFRPLNAGSGVKWMPLRILNV